MTAQMGVVEFGRLLVETLDLDPLYVGLRRVEWDADRLHRYCLAYFCLYHAGASALLCELQADKFWEALTAAARNEVPTPVGGKWPRGRERRHWRGQQAMKCVAYLTGRYREPEEFCRRILALPEHGPPAEGGATPAGRVIDLVREHAIFGPWIAFKVADVAERCLGKRISFDDGHVFVFDQPREAAIMVWREATGMPDNARPRNPKEILPKVVAHLQDQLSDLAAPPDGDRPLGLQEVETVLCKWKSHRSGHYPPGLDTREYRKQLAEWGEHSWASRQLLGVMPTYPGDAS